MPYVDHTGAASQQYAAAPAMIRTGLSGIRMLL